MENDFKSRKNKSPKHFGFKHKIAAIIITPLLIATFLSIVDLQAEMTGKPESTKTDIKKILSDIVKLFTPKPKPVNGWGTTKLNMASIKSAIDTYLLNTGQYPTTLNDLITDPNLNGWAGPYMNPKQLNDTWGRPYIYIPYNGGKYKLISYGADGSPGGKGKNADIYND